MLESEMAWLHPLMERDEADALIGTQDGTFLVRPMKSNKQGHVLSVVYKGRGTHHGITPGDGGVLLVNQKQHGSCTTLRELIEYLGTKRKGWPVALTFPINRSEDSTAKSQIDASDKDDGAGTPPPGVPLAPTVIAGDVAASSEEDAVAPPASRDTLQHLVKGAPSETSSTAHGNPQRDESDDGILIPMRPAVLSKAESSSTRPSDPNALRLVVETSMQEHAGTNGSVFASFLVKGDWTEPYLFFTGAKRGEVKEKIFEIFPDGVKGTSVRFSMRNTETTSGHAPPESWGYWRIEADGVEVLKDDKGSMGTPKSKSKFWIADRGTECYLNTVVDLEPPEDDIAKDIAIAVQSKLEIVDNPNEGAWVQSKRGYRRSSFVRKGSAKTIKMKPPEVAPLIKPQTADQRRLMEIIQHLFAQQHQLPPGELILTREDQSMRFNMADLYEPLKTAGALSGNRAAGAFDLAGTIARADSDGRGVVNLWQFVGALDATVEVEAVARAAAGRARNENILQEKEALLEAEREAARLREEQERSWREAEERDRLIREQMFLAEQTMQREREQERRRLQLEHVQMQREQEARERAERKKRQAIQRRAWNTQSLNFPWELQQAK